MALTRATKIVATIGPASSDLNTLTRMIAAGVDVVRLNFSHGKAQDHIDRAELVRQAALSCGREVAIMADLQGPKIRVGKFEHGQIELVDGAQFKEPALPEDFRPRGARTDATTRAGFNRHITISAGARHLPKLATVPMSWASTGQSYEYLVTQ